MTDTASVHLTEDEAVRVVAALRLLNTPGDSDLADMIEAMAGAMPPAALPRPLTPEEQDVADFVGGDQWTPEQLEAITKTGAQRDAEAYHAGQVFSPPLVNHYERGQRDLLNVLLTPNKAATDVVDNLMDRNPSDNPHGKLSFETLVWITTIAAQLGIEPKDEVPAPTPGVGENPYDLKH